MDVQLITQANYFRKIYKILIKNCSLYTMLRRGTRFCLHQQWIRIDSTRTSYSEYKEENKFGTYVWILEHMFTLRFHKRKT
jgi:hypothetical protein